MTFVTYCDERRIPQPPKASIVDALAHYRGGLNSSSDDCSIISITFLKEATAIGRVVWPPQRPICWMRLLKPILVHATSCQTTAWLFARE